MLQTTWKIYSYVGFFPSIVMFRSINKTMDNNKTLNTCFEELKHFPLHNKSNRKLFYHKTLLY